jgi:hypothetical protein
MRRFLAQKSQDAIEESSNSTERSTAIEQVRDGAEEIPQQFPGARNSGDVESDRVEEDFKAKQLKIQRTQHQVKNLALSSGDIHNERRSSGVDQATNRHSTNGQEFATLIYEIGDGEDTRGQSIFRYGPYVKCAGRRPLGGDNLAQANCAKSTSRNPAAEETERLAPRCGACERCGKFV